MSRCYVVGASELNHFIMPAADDFIIAADGGYNHLKRLRITPNLIIGDADSISTIPDGIEFLKYSPFKDETDSFLAAKKAVELGYNEIWFFGCCGGRFDHTIANVQMIAYFSKLGIKCRLFHDRSDITAITDTSITFDKTERGYVSVFSFDDNSYGVNIWGLKYSAQDVVLSNSMPVGVSNEFVGVESGISVEDGTLLIIKERMTMVD